MRKPRSMLFQLWSAGRAWADLREQGCMLLNCNTFGRHYDQLFLLTFSFLLLLTFDVANVLLFFN